MTDDETNAEPAQLISHTLTTPKNFWTRGTVAQFYCGHEKRYELDIVKEHTTFLHENKPFSNLSPIGLTG